MDDDNNKKPARGKSAGPRRDGPRREGAGKGGYGGAPKKTGFGGGPKKAGFGGGPRRDGDKPFAKRPPRRDGDGASDGARKPYVKREYGDRPPRAAEGAERRPYVKRERGEDSASGERERKPYVKRDYGDRPATGGAQRDSEGRPKYWGKRPGKAEREALKTGPGDKISEASPRDRKPRFQSGDGPKRDFSERPKRDFGDRPKRDFGDRPKRDFSDKPRRDFKEGNTSSERKTFVKREAMEAEDGERIAKRLARAGISSRRDAEDLIASGRVKVNGKVLDSPAFNVTASDRIELDGNEIPAIERTRLFLFHKPAGVVTTNRDPEGRKTVFDVLPEELPRLMTVGRLDINTEGLLLLTNDGGLSRVLELPATGWLRRYRVRVHGKVNEQALAGLKEGIAVDGVFYGAIEATLEREQGTNAWLTLGLREGKNREVKNILGYLGLDVTRLIRISYGPFQLGELPEGHVLEIKGRTLREQLGERLVEESGANFDADIAKPFSNRPVRRDVKRRPAEADAPARRARQALTEGEGGLIKNFRRDKGREREGFLDRLSTKPERPRFEKGEGGEGRFKRGPKPDGGFGSKPRSGRKPDDRDAPPAETPQRRTNVWMAPGARPQGTGKLASEKAAARQAKKSGPGQGNQKSAAFKPRDGEGRPRGDRPSGPRKGGPGADRRR